MLLLFLFFPCGVFVALFFHRQSRACGEADHSAEVFGGDLRLHAPPLFLGILVLIQQCPHSGQSGHGRHQRNRPRIAAAPYHPASAAGEVVRMVRDACKKPLMVKLSPQAENIPEMCKAVEAAGADAISLTNTFQACAIDLEKRRPVFDNIFAGLSGPAVRPIALRMVWQAVGAVNIPVVGLGGIATGKDALEFIMAGATAVQVGAANFANPRAMETIAEEMAAWMDAHGVKTLDEIRGCAR